MSESELDTKFEEARADAWIIEVENEIEIVERLLDEVSQACATQPYEDDTIMTGLANTGKALGEAWTGVIDVYKNVIEQFRNITGELVKGIGNTLQKIGEFIEGKSY